MSFEEWLNKRYAAATAKEYHRLAGRWLATAGEAQARAAGYTELTAWLAEVRLRTPHPVTVQMHLFALRAYYTYLMETGARSDDPTSALVLRAARRRRVHLPNLLTAEELRSLRTSCGRLAPREAVIMDLLCVTALRSSEITMLTIHDVNLERGTLGVPASGRLNARTISLPRQQCQRLKNYLETARPVLNNRNLNALVITRKGNRERSDNIKHLVKRLRWMLPERRLTPTLIRQSVIAMMLAAGQELRAVQLFAGHRHPGSTERYRFTGLEELRAAVEQLHPMS